MDTLKDKTIIFNELSDIDIVDLRDDNLDMFIKMNILNNGKVIYSLDDNKLLEKFCDETHRIYKENEAFMYFRINFNILTFGARHQMLKC